MLIHRPDLFFLYVGRDWCRDARLSVEIGFGARENVKPGEIGWVCWWTWSSASLPQFIWNGWTPIGFKAFGRCWVLR